MYNWGNSSLSDTPILGRTSGEQGLTICQAEPKGESKPGKDESPATPPPQEKPEPKKETPYVTQITMIRGIFEHLEPC